VALEDRGVLLAGDALATFDNVSGQRRLGLHRLNDDRETARASLDRLETIDADVVLSGHGNPWTCNMHKAVEIARGVEEPR